MRSSLRKPSEIIDSKDEVAHGGFKSPVVDCTILNKEMVILQKLVPKRNRFLFFAQNPKGKRLRLQKWSQTHALVSSETFETSECRSIYRKSVKRKLMKDTEGVENIDANPSSSNIVSEGNPPNLVSPRRTIRYNRKKRTNSIL